MKSIIIERVTNGWLVREPSYGPVGIDPAHGGMFVYRTVKEIQQDLPKLIADDPEHGASGYTIETSR